MSSDDEDAPVDKPGVDDSSEVDKAADGQLSEASNAPGDGHGADAEPADLAEDGDAGGLSAFIAASEAATRAEAERAESDRTESERDESEQDETERDEASALWAGDQDDDDEDDPQYLEVRRSAPGWAMSRWIISGVVATAVVVLSFLMIPRLFTPDDTEPAAEGSGVSGGSAPAASTTAAPVVSYPDVVLASGPAHYWKFEMQAAGTDTIGAASLEIGGEAAVLGSSSYSGGMGSIDCSGTAKSRALSGLAETPAGDFSIEVWINTVTAEGGPIVTFGNQKSGTSTKVDRVMYMATNGKIYFGTFDKSRDFTVSELPVNNGTWRHVVGTMSSTTGLTLYVDGAAVDTEEDGTTTNKFEGYWKVCGDNTSGWPGNSGRPAFTGTVDDVAVYARALTAQEILDHYEAAKGL